MMKSIYIRTAIVTIGLLTVTPHAVAQRETPTKAEGDEVAVPAKADMPWHQKTAPNYRFSFRGPYGGLAGVRHLKANFDWYAVSEDLSEKPGAFSSYLLYIGVNSEGRHEGIIYDASVAGAMEPKVAVNLLNKISGLTLTAEQGEGIPISLNAVESATVPNAKDPSKADTVHFRRFQFPVKSYRMMGALPDENRMSFYYSKPNGKIGYFAYHARGAKNDHWVYSIGYAKELSQGAIKRAQQ